MCQPNYKKIYLDIIEKKYPEKFDRCSVILNKKDLNSADILRLNVLIFDKKDIVEKNFLRHKAYNENTIIEILEYQKKNNLNIVQTAKYFNVSRNTISKWKNMYAFKINILSH